MLHTKDRPTRRQAITAAVTTVSALALTSTLRAGPLRADPPRTEPGQAAAPVGPSNGPNQTRTALHQEVDLKASAQRIYEVLLDAKLFAAFSQEPAEIHGEAGGTFSLFGARIVGRIVELVPNERIVQAWRPAYWEPGLYSMVRFEMKSQGAQTRVVLDHTGFPEGKFDSLSSGWNEHYWDRLGKFLG